MILLALIFAFTLACIAGTQFFYLMFLEKVNRQCKQRIAELERQNTAILRELRKTQALLERQSESQERWPEWLGDDDTVR